MIVSHCEYVWFFLYMLDMLDYGKHARRGSRIEDNSFSKKEGLNHIGSDSRKPMNSNNKGNQSNKNHFDSSDEVFSNSELMHTMPSSMNNDESNASPSNQEEGELIKGNQSQLIEATKEQEGMTKISKTNQQQNLTPTADQATLAGSPRHDLNHWDDVEGKSGISTHGPSCHGPRDLLEVIGRALKSKPKVAQSTVSTAAVA